MSILGGRGCGGKSIFMTRIQKIVSLIPFLIICGCLVVSWVDFIFGDLIASTRHYITPALVVLNGVLYFIRFRAGIWMTGAILFFGIANVISLSSGISTFSVMGSPQIETRSFLILIVYGIIDFGVFGHLFFRKNGASDIARSRKDDFTPQTLEEYNRELEEANLRIEAGRYVTQEDLEKEMKKW